jgi:hypothetical protein
MNRSAETIRSTLNSGPCQRSRKFMSDPLVG